MHQQASLNKPRGSRAHIQGDNFIGPRQKCPIVIGKAVDVLA